MKSSIWKNRIILILIVFAAAVFTELFVFNFRTIQSLFYKEIQIPVDGLKTTGILSFGDGVYKFDPDSEEARVIYLSDLDELECAGEVHNIRFDAETPSSIDLMFIESGVLNADIYVRDEGNDRYTMLEGHKFLEGNEASKYVFIDPAGKVKTIAMNLSMTNGAVLNIKSITINARRKLNFLPVRFLYLLLFFTCITALRKNSFLWKQNALENTKWKLPVMVVLCAALIMPQWYLIQSNLYISSFMNFNPYQDLAESFAAGHTYILEEPSEALKNLSNPYDDTLRTAEGVETKWDYAYYNGKYYVYFGALPCLIFYLPVYLFLGVGMPNPVPVTICAIFLIFGIYELIKALASVYCRDLKTAAHYILTVLVYLGCQIVFFMNQPDGYSVPVACGETFLVWGLYFWVSSLKEKGVSLWRLAVGSLLISMVAGCRPNMEVYAVLALPLFVDRVKIMLKEKQNKKMAALLAALVLPAVPAAVLIMYYNAVRFGSPFDFGNAYNLTVSDVSRNPVSLDKLIVGIYEYLLKLPDLTYTFPFMSIPGDGTSVNELKHCFIHMEYIFAGLLPVNLILFAIPYSFKKAHRSVFVITAAVTAFFLMIFEAESAGIVYRYEADFSLVFLIASVVALMNMIKDGKDIRRFLICALAVSVLFHMNFYFLTGLKYPLLWGNTPLYYKIYYAFNFL